MNDNEKIERIRSLQNTQRTPEEEAEYIRLNSEVTGYPQVMFTKEFGQKLSEAITKADALLEAHAISLAALTDDFYAKMEIGQEVVVNVVADSSYSKTHRWRKKTNTTKKFKITPLQGNYNMSTIKRIE